MSPTPAEKQKDESNQPTPGTSSEAELDADALFDELAQSADSESVDEEPEKEEGQQPGKADSAPYPEASDTSPSTDEPPSAPADPDLAELKRKLAAAEHENRSHRSRQSTLAHQSKAMQAELDEARKELAALKRQQSGESSAPNAEPLPTEATTAEGSVDLKQFAEDFPEVFAAMNAFHRSQQEALNKQWEERLSKVSESVDTVTQPVQELQQKQQAEYIQTQRSALAAVHPDWEQIQADQRFWDWLEVQPDGVKQLSQSAAAADNIALLNLFKQGQPVPQPATPATTPAGGKARLPRSDDAAAPIPKRGSTLPTGGVPDDEDAAFEFWAKNA